MKTIDFKEWHKIGKKLYGANVINWKFRCPMCNKVQTAQDLIDAGIKRDKVDLYIGFSCIGRFNGKGKSPLKSKAANFPDGCDWTLGGLLGGMGREITIIKDGKEHHRFEFADDYEIETKTILDGKASICCGASIEFIKQAKPGRRYICQKCKKPCRIGMK